MTEDLKKQGLFIDGSFILRVLEQDAQEDTSQLKDENEVFLEKLGDLRSLVLEISKKLESFSSEIQSMKMLAINKQNLAKSSAKQRILQKQLIQTKTIEKSLELDRLKAELQSYQRTESEFQEVFENFHQNQ